MKNEVPGIAYETAKGIGRALTFEANRRSKLFM
jgi:hypothetical protein